MLPALEKESLVVADKEDDEDRGGKDDWEFLRRTFRCFFFPPRERLGLQLFSAPFSGDVSPVSRYLRYVTQSSTSCCVELVPLVKSSGR